MSFDFRGFSPVHVNAGPKAPRIFTYVTEDELEEVIQPGYFNDQKLIMRPHSFVKVVCKDAIAELVIKSNDSNVIVRDEAPSVVYFDEDEALKKTG